MDAGQLQDVAGAPVVGVGMAWVRLGVAPEVVLQVGVVQEGQVDGGDEGQVGAQPHHHPHRPLQAQVAQARRDLGRRSRTRGTFMMVTPTLASPV